MDIRQHQPNWWARMRSAMNDPNNGTLPHERLLGNIFLDGINSGNVTATNIANDLKITDYPARNLDGSFASPREIENAGVEALLLVTPGSYLRRGTGIVDDVAKKAMGRYKNIDEIHSRCDCSEIAEDIFDEVGNGQILEITYKNSNWMNARQNGIVDEFGYHQIYTKDGYVYDTRYSDDPVKYDDYMNDIRGLNDEIEIRDVTNER